jgi:hypothetical protein
MKLWLRRILICCLLVGLLLSLTLAVVLHRRLQVVGSRPWFDRGRELASDVPTVLVVRSMEFDSARAGLLASPVLDSALTASNPSPPRQENHGPPESMGHWRVAGQAGNSNQRPRAPFLDENTGSNHQF